MNALPAARARAILVACSLLAALPAGAAVAGKAPADAARNAAATRAKASYSLGVSIGEQLRQSLLTPDAVAFDALTKGLQAALAGKVRWTGADQETVGQLMREVRQEAILRNRTAAGEFLAANGKDPAVTTTASGLQYRVARAGDGESPGPTDVVTVHYRGTLLDGSEFDSSYKRNEPASFPSSQVIRGWQEALPLMKTGGEYELYIPPQLGYDLNSPPGIPPGSLLKFHIELLRVEHPAAAAAGATPVAPTAPAAAR